MGSAVQEDTGRARQATKRGPKREHCECSAPLCIFFRSEKVAPRCVSRDVGYLWPPPCLCYEPLGQLAESAREKIFHFHIITKRCCEGRKDANVV